MSRKLVPSVLHTWAAGHSMDGLDDNSTKGKLAGPSQLQMCNNILESELYSLTSSALKALEMSFLKGRKKGPDTGPEEALLEETALRQRIHLT